MGMHMIRLVGVWVAILLGASAALAQPVVSSASGTWAHKGTVTISGSGFGTKPTAAPLVWDDASGTDLGAKWDGAIPSAATTAVANIAYRAPIRGIAPPHTRTNRYIAGAHAQEAYDAGYNVMVWKNRSVTYPSTTYVSYYFRADDAWVFGGDDNFKNFAWSVGPDPYQGNYWYIEYNPRPTSRTSYCGWTLYDSGSMGLNPAITWGGGCTNPMGGQWVKVEMLIRFSRGTDGFIRVYENGQSVINYTGTTDTVSGSTRVLGIGGYARIRNSNNYRYYTDLYVDTTLAHVVLGNASTLAASTKREVQVPTGWTATSVTIAANLGAFASGERAYLYVVDSNGNANAQGYPVTIGSGGGGTTTLPNSPKNLRVVP